MNAIQIGKPGRFIKGVAKVKVTDPFTGNIIGYDRIISDSAMSTDVNLNEVVGGLGNKLQGIIPDTVRLSGTLTSQAFSLEARGLITGGAFSYNATASVCETITATGSTLTVSQTPVKHIGQPATDTEAWAYVREHNASSYEGTNYRVDLTTKQILDFVATSGTQYDVYYFVQSASAEQLTIPAIMNKPVVTIEIEYGVFSFQNGSSTNSTFQGWQHVIIPRAILTGNAGIDGNQTDVSTTDWSWQALDTSDNAVGCDTCGLAGSNYAYYVYVPCGDPTIAVQELATIGGGISLEVGATKQFPVVYVMPDGSPVTPTYTDLTYVSAATGTATVSAAGVIEGVAAGDTTVTATLEKSDGTTLTTVCNVTVTA